MFIVITGCVATAIFVYGLTQHWSTGGGGEDAGVGWTVLLLAIVMLVLFATGAEPRRDTMLTDRLLERAGID